HADRPGLILLEVLDQEAAREIHGEEHGDHRAARKLLFAEVLVPRVQDAEHEQTERDFVELARVAIDRRDRVAVEAGEVDAPGLVRLSPDDFRIEPVADADQRRAETRGIGKPVAPFQKSLAFLLREEPHGDDEADGSPMARQSSLVDLEDEHGIFDEMIPLVEKHVPDARAHERSDDAVDDEVAAVLFRPSGPPDLPVDELVPAEEDADVKEAVITDAVPGQGH